jgi:hypothetical protein
MTGTTSERRNLPFKRRTPARSSSRRHHDTRSVHARRHDPFPQGVLGRRKHRANRGSPAIERKRGIQRLAQPTIDRRRVNYRYFQCTQRRWPKPWVELKRLGHFMHRLPSGGWIVAPGLILPAFWTKDVYPKSSGGSEGRIGPAETDVAAAKKNAPQRAPNKGTKRSSNPCSFFPPTISSLR